MTMFVARDLRADKKNFLFSGTDQLQLRGIAVRIAVNTPVSIAFQADLQ
jgi:hypothetical protein